MQVQKNIFFQKKRVCNITVFLSTCVLQNVKSYGFFVAIFWPIFLSFKQKTVKVGISSHFSEQKFTKNGIFGSYCLVQVGSYYLVQVGCVLKNANLDQIITPKIFARNFFKKHVPKPLFYSVFWQSVF